MSATGDVEATERFLVGCAAALRSRGIALIYGAGDAFEYGGDDGTCAGACITHAQEHLPRNVLAKLGKMALPEGDLFSAAWDSIENGFDGEPLRVNEAWGCDDLPEWHALGARLREQLHPVDVASLSRAP